MPADLDLKGLALQVGQQLIEDLFALRVQFGRILVKRHPGPDDVVAVVQGLQPRLAGDACPRFVVGRFRLRLGHLPRGGRLGLADGRRLGRRRRPALSRQQRIRAARLRRRAVGIGEVLGDGRFHRLVLRHDPHHQKKGHHRRHEVGVSHFPSAATFACHTRLLNSGVQIHGAKSNGLPIKPPLPRP